jgi:amino acid transporter
MLEKIKHLFIGHPLPTAKPMRYPRVGRLMALGIFSSTTLSSIVYVIDALLRVLLPESAFSFAPSITIGVMFVLLVIALSYRQIIYAYPGGGDAYTNSQTYLGSIPSLTVAATMLIRCVLVIAISTCAAVNIIISVFYVFGVKDLGNYRVEISIAFIALISLMSIRGLQNYNQFFIIPTYLFIFVMILLTITGNVYKTTFPIVYSVNFDISFLLGDINVLYYREFYIKSILLSCVIIAGIDAIPRNTPGFRNPESRNAVITFLLITTILMFLFAGLILLLSHYNLTNSDREAILSHQENILSLLTRNIFGVNFIYIIVQMLMIYTLLLAAIGSFSDFSRLVLLLAHDSLLPRQFTQRGDRLSFSNSILSLTVFSFILIIMFNGDIQAMMPLYAISAFWIFSFEQMSMSIHWRRSKQNKWVFGVFINTIGAIITMLLLIAGVIVYFTHAAWALLTIIPILVLVFRAIRSHYISFSKALSLDDEIQNVVVRRHTMLVLVPGIHRGIIPSLAYAKSIAPDNTTALYINANMDSTEKINADWRKWGQNIPLVVIDSPYRRVLPPILEYINKLDEMYDDDILSIVLPEIVPPRWWQHLLHNQTALLIKAALLFRGRVAVISIPYNL